MVSRSSRSMICLFDIFEVNCLIFSKLRFNEVFSTNFSQK